MNNKKGKKFYDFKLEINYDTISKIIMRELMNITNENKILLKFLKPKIFI